MRDCVRVRARVNEERRTRVRVRVRVGVRVNQERRIRVRVRVRVGVRVNQKNNDKGCLVRHKRRSMVFEPRLTVRVNVRYSHLTSRFLKIFKISQDFQDFSRF